MELLNKNFKMDSLFGNLKIREGKDGVWLFYLDLQLLNTTCYNRFDFFYKRGHFI